MKVRRSEPCEECNGTGHQLVEGYNFVLKERRHALGLRLEDIAHKLNKSPTYLSYIENGKKKSPRMLEAYRQLLEQEEEAHLQLLEKEHA